MNPLNVDHELQIRKFVLENNRSPNKLKKLKRFLSNTFAVGRERLNLRPVRGI